MEICPSLRTGLLEIIKQKISMKALHMIAFCLVIIGGLNWLLESFGWGLGGWVSANWWGSLMKIVYVLVGLSAIYLIFEHKKTCKDCEKVGSTDSIHPM